MMTNPSQTTSHLATLYEQDYYLWLETTTKILEEGKLNQLDVINLKEEIADMGKSLKQALKSNLRVILMHLLKYKYQSEKRTNSWLYTILEHRNRLEDCFTDSPSLKFYFREVFPESYRKARKMAAVETGLDINSFPIESPFTPEETLDCDYLT